MRWLIVVVLGLLSTGCVAQASKRMAVHNRRNAAIAHEENPTEATAKLKAGTEAQNEYLGEPKEPVKPEEFDRDLKELRNASLGLFGGLPWIELIIGAFGVVTAAATGNWLSAYRQLAGVLTNAIEENGSAAVKKSVAAATKGSRISGMLSRWVTRAEKKNGKPATASSGL